MAKFKHLGFFLEFSIDSKFRGTLSIDKPDREIFGYEGTKTQVAEETILLDGGKKVKKGETYKTRLYPLCGRVVKNS